MPEKGKGYNWGGDAPPEISPHSLAKHRILKEYVETYIEVLTKRAHGKDVFRLALVDGFAGGGEYTDPRASCLQPGSPLILLDATRRAEVAVNAGRTKKLKIDGHFWFVEKNPINARYLRDVLSRRADLVIDRSAVEVIEGEFDEQLDRIIIDIKRAKVSSGRTIFVLDQYGYTDVRVPVLNKIFQQLPNAEVFLTVAAGWILAYLKDPAEIGRRLGIEPGAAKRFHEDIVKNLRAEDQPGFFVGDSSKRENLFVIQRLLHDIFAKSVNSTFYTPFFIVSRDSNRAYWFMHMANHETAHDVVKKLHWKIENNFQHFGSPGLNMLGYDPGMDPEVTGQLPLYYFDNAARSLTHQGLMRSLPGRISSDYPEGVTFITLFKALCNETTATKDLLAEVVRDLCVAGELEKRGGQGEQRELRTLPHDDDRIRIARQIRLIKY
ncbi:MAG TPA: three-Cys-motif partner protein TcmP [Polyangiaceae bacterium]|jgi:three-Cys-motif partner protein|nr:three-Cys-motif partner protein TcmP [Polyangiaceae bacterium]